MLMAVQLVRRFNTKFNDGRSLTNTSFQKAQLQVCGLSLHLWCKKILDKQERLCFDP